MRRLAIALLLLVAAGAWGQITTTNEKLSLLGEHLPISADGLGSDDKAQLLGIYPGVTLGAPPATTGGTATTRRLFQLLDMLSVFRLQLILGAGVVSLAIAGGVALRIVQEREKTKRLRDEQRG